MRGREDETYQVRLRQATSLGPHSPSIFKLISTGRSRKDLGILRVVRASIESWIYLIKIKLSWYIKSARLYY
jgi:hypothetical protein